MRYIKTPTKINSGLLFSLIARVLCILLIFLGYISPDYRLVLFIVAGLVLGLYYGYYNDIIWEDKGELKDKDHYRVHQIWIHTVSGLVGGVSLYLLLPNLEIINTGGTVALKLSSFVLFVVFLFSFVGLLPRALWFLTYAKTPNP